MRDEPPVFGETYKVQRTSRGQCAYIVSGKNLSKYTEIRNIGVQRKHAGVKFCGSINTRKMV